MISDVPCEPELPPELMMSGRKIASTVARSISFWYTPSAVAVNISPMNSALSQPARFLIIAPEADLRVRLVERFHTAQLLDVLRLLFLDRVDDVVDRDRRP